MEYKDLASILAGPSLTPEEAYRRASPAQRRAWFGDGPPAKAAQYDLPPAAPVGLPPELEAAVQAHRHDHVGQYGGPCTHPMANPSETWGGMCAKHRGTPAERAEQRRWQRHADATVLAQQLGRATDWAPVYGPGEAEQQASRLGKAPVVDRVSFLP